MVFKLFGEIATSSKTTPYSMPYFAIITFNSSDHRYFIKHFNTFLNPSMRKSYKQWLIYAYHRETGEIVAYVWGKRHLATVQRLKTKLKQLGIH